MAGRHALDDHEQDERDDHEVSAFDSMMTSSDESGEAYDDEYGDEYGEDDRPGRRRRRPMWGGWALLAVLVLVLAGGGVWLHDLVTKPPAKAAPSAPAFTILPLNVNPGASVPSAPAPFPASVPGPRDPQAVWITKLSTATYLPSRALSAYVSAQTQLAQRDPGCGINWTTLAGIGWVESHHGQFGGASIGPDDRETRPIIGPALDGTNGTQRIPDTDHGVLDGDTQWDRALGPMQFLPTTWREWGLRASGDGQAPDPQNIADAALTAGNYLCKSVGDMTTPANWWKAVYIYNNSDEYGVEVYSAAQAYSDATR